ncbi:MAG: phage baseplate protein [bacterium]
MRILNEQLLLQIWEAGQSQHPVDRALTVLQAAYPESTRAALAKWSKGQRDARLLQIRQQIFGSLIHGWITCESCQEKMEVTLQTDHLTLSAPEEEDVEEHSFNQDGYETVFRLPNSFDLAEVAQCENQKSAEKLLQNLCILWVKRDGKPVQKSRIPKKLLSAISKKMVELDPLAEIRLMSECKTCGELCQMDLDVISYVWAEIAALAKRILHEVHILARSYAWSEQDILSLPARRRQSYLALVTA